MSEGQRNVLTSGGRLNRFAWLPIPILLAAIIAGRAAGLRETYENNSLRLILSFTFYTLVSLGTLFLIGRKFLASGMPGLLLLECGVVLWSLAGTVGDIVGPNDANINVTIFNSGIMLAGLCHLAGAVFVLRSQKPLRAKRLWLCGSCSLTLGALWLIAWAALAGWLPVFFIPGHGGTTVRYCVLTSAIGMFVLSASMLYAGQRSERTPFISWYSFALLLLAVGLFGIMIQLSLWSVVNWLSRTAQWLGGFYLLFAAIAALRESNLPILPTGKKSHPSYYRYVVAVVVVLVAAAVRMAFLTAMGMQSPYLVFYPAVVFAAIYGGMRAGLLATVLSAVLADYFWIEPTGQFALRQPSDWLGLMIFLLNGTIVAWFSETLHSARVKAAAAKVEADFAAERLEAMEALRQSEAKYRGLFENRLDGYALCRMLYENGAPVDFVYLDVNEAFERLTGLKGVVGRKVSEVIPGIRQSSPELFRIYGRVASTGKPERFETYLESLGIWFSISVYSPRKEHFVAVFDNITERKRAEEAMRKSEDRFRTMADSMPQLGWVAKGDGFIYWYNRGWYEYTGTTPEQMEGWGWQSVHDPEALPSVLERWKASIATGEPFEMEFPLRGADGKFRQFLTRGTPLKDSHGRVVQWCGTNTDISERAASEAALSKAKVELEQRVKERTADLSRTVETLSDEVSKRTLAEQVLHERSEKLRVLASELTLTEQRERQRLAQILHDGLQQLLVAAKLRLTVLERTNDGVSRQVGEEVSDLISDTIEMSRSLTAELSPPILKEGGLVPALEWLARWMQDKHELGVSLDAKGQAGPISDDLTVLLFHATRELLFNVVKHAGVKSAHVQVSRMDDSIQITVADEGAGFDPANLSADGGSLAGLGLFSIRERIGIMGGSMEIDSAPGRGSRFTLTAPLAKSKDEKSRTAGAPKVSVVIIAPEKAAAPEGVIRVVLVDDHIVMRQGLATLLREEADIAIVGEASDGEAAVKLVRQVRPDVVLMDISMPGMNGIEATRIIHAELPDVRVIGLSMFQEVERAEAMREAGAVNYLTKTGASDSVVAAIRACMGGKK